MTSQPAGGAAPAWDPPPADDRWHPDVLGDGWEARTLPLRPDSQGPAVATLVRRRPAVTGDAPGGDARGPRKAALYVHGYVDYFFQTHLADLWADLGYDLYALDLRAHGRSLRPHQLPNFVTDLALHAEELDAAVHVLREEEHYDVVVGMGHSTGGLVMSLWAHARRGRRPRSVDALVLNSPWFELNRGWWDRVVTTRVADLVGPLVPRLVVGQIAPFYGRMLHVDTGGPWTYDLAWKPHEGFGARAAWIRAIRRGHRAVAQGLDIDVPVLVLASTRTGPADRDHPDLTRSDSVLDVQHIVERAPLLGPDVTVRQIEDGVHDLALSAEPARTRYVEAVKEWVRAQEARSLIGSR